LYNKIADISAILFILKKLERRDVLNVEFYTIHCPACKIIKMLMDKKGIKYTMEDDRDKVLKKANELGVKGAPFAVIDNVVYVNDNLKKWIMER
jgi:protein-disulfide isomerase